MDEDDTPSPLQLDRSPDSRPWLRLNARGLVGSARAITFTSDGQRLCAAGDNKEIVVWNRQGDRWNFERTIRWQVQRGERGRITTLVAGSGSLVFGGFGAMGELGEIVVVDAQTGRSGRGSPRRSVGPSQATYFDRLCSQPSA